MKTTGKSKRNTKMGRGNAISAIIRLREERLSILCRIQPSNTVTNALNISPWVKTSIFFKIARGREIILDLQVYDGNKK
jgi:hypothetical protein